MGTRRIVAYLGIIFAAVVVFQLFFRYQYIHGTREAVMRIDRLTGASCYMPCLQPTPIPTPEPSPSPTREPTPEPTPSDLADQARAIRLAKADGHAAKLVASHNPNDYYWKAEEPEDALSTSYVNEHCLGPNQTPIPLNLGGHGTEFNTYLAAAQCPGIKHTFLVGYVDRNGSGWWWEVHVDTAVALYVNDNDVLRLKWRRGHG